MNHYGVIMAGGGGTRFWPLSRQKTPKQLLNLSGKDLMVNEAVDRMATVIGKSNILIVTSELQASAMIEATAGRVFPGNILTEPAARNTAACIGYAAMKILKTYGDGIMIITPADHYIKDVPSLVNVFRKAIETAEQQDKLVTIGIKPTFPSTGYGYIKCVGDGSKSTMSMGELISGVERINDAAKAAESEDKRISNVTETVGSGDKTTEAGDIRQVLEFREKPDEETARGYLQQGTYLWNSGMFIWKAGLILEKMKEYVPDVYADLEKIGSSMNTPGEQGVLHEVYPKIRNISIDYAVMEPSAAHNDVLVIPGDFGWSDIGSWDMMEVLHDRDDSGNVVTGNALLMDTRNSIIHSGSKQVVVLGVDNLVVVDVADALLVCDRNKTQSIRLVVDKLCEEGKTGLL